MLRNLNYALRLIYIKKKVGNGGGGDAPYDDSALKPEKRKGARHLHFLRGLEVQVLSREARLTSNSDLLNL